MLMLDIIIFSKDRAMQCDAALRSIYRYFDIDKKISILWTASNIEYADGYSRLIDIYGDNVVFVKESSFLADLLNLLNTGLPYTLFFTDDSLVIRPFTYDHIFKEFENNEQILGLNLRVGKNIVDNYCLENIELDKFFNRNSGIINHLLDVNNMEPIKFINNTYTWRDKNNLTWGYSMAAAGQIYRTKDLLGNPPNLRVHSITSPNALEDALMLHPLNKEFLICPDEHVIIEICINEVVTTHAGNPHGNISTKYLNDKWLEGFKIDDECFFQLKGNSKRFLDVNLKFIR